MFRITTETCGAFIFAEILIMAALNVENARLASEAASDLGSISSLKNFGMRSLVVAC